ncbi:MAG: catalase/peroxidase HPI, partial [bacterium]|nr:catalase/peroxidase HPI [bacterium]
MDKRNLLMAAAIIMASVISFSCTSPTKPQSEKRADSAQAKSNQFWWPDQLDLSPLRDHDISSNPYGNFNYAEEFKKLDLKALKSDIDKVLTTSQDWWPADYGNYGPLFIRMAWHSAGTYRTIDGRGGAGGGQQRFDPLNSWPDNANLDKARRLLWPIKQKYGKSLSWADLMVLTGNVAMENMGFKTLGFAGGRADDWEPDMVYWGPETKWLDAKRRGKDGKLQKPLAAVQMGLIYVNPEGPNGKPDPLAAAKAIRESFGLMAMNDEETVALIAGGHSFGKAHGAHKPKECVGPEPGAAAIEEQGLGWKNKCGKGKGEDTVTSGLEGAWTQTPVKWSHLFLKNLFSFEWKQTKSPGGAIQWIPTDESIKSVPDAHIKGKFHAPIMLTTDLALREDPAYQKIAKRFLENPKEFEDAFARAWFKLTHRDMGPLARYVGDEVPDQTFLWQDPLPEAGDTLMSEGDIANLKEKILASGLSVPELVRTAWASASSFRASDMRGGANGGRIRLEPQRSWAVNNPEELSKVLDKLEEIKKEFESSSPSNNTKVSMADLVILGGSAAIEKVAKDSGYNINVPFKPGRVDASQEQTDIESFAVLEPNADGFRNYYTEKSFRSPAEMLVDKADQLSLTVPEMTVLIGGMRVLNANADGSKHGVFTEKPGTLNNAFFVNLLDMSTDWKKSSSSEGIYEGYDSKTNKLKWTATPVDLIFGSNSELRAIAEVYAYNDSQ